MGENDYKLEQIKQGLDPVCTNQSTRHMHTLRLYDRNIVGPWGGGLVLDCKKSAKKNRRRMVKMTEVDSSLPFPRE